MESKIYFIGNAEVFESTLYIQSNITQCKYWLDELNEVNLDTETEGIGIIAASHKVDDSSETKISETAIAGFDL